MLTAVLLAVVAMLVLAAPADAQEPGLVEVVELEGLVDGQTAAFLEGTLQGAAERDAELVVLSLDVAGGVGVEPGSLVQPIVESDVPVLAFVGGAGARAHGAGAWIAQAAHVLALAPVTQTGDALPFDLAEEGSAGADGFVQLAELRGRDAEIAAAMTDGAVVVVRPEGAEPGSYDPSAVPAGAPVIEVGAQRVAGRGVADLVARSLPDALDAVQGVQVVASGQTTTLSFSDVDATVRFQDPGLIRRVLSTVTDPTLAYVLLVAGALTLGFELFQPGFGVAGVSAIPLLALALVGLWVLPTNGFAFVAIVVGLALLALDLALARLGALTLVGTAALAAGSYWLFPRSGPAAEVLAVSGWLVALLVAFAVVFFVVIMTQVLKAQGSQALVSAEQVVGERGVVRSMLNPEGHVFVAGQLWRARAPEAAGRVGTGTVVRVMGLNDRLTLDVELDDAPVPPAQSAR